MDSVDALPTQLRLTGARPFSLAALDADIDGALAALPPDAKGAVVLYGEQKDGVTTAKLAYAANLGDGWSAMVEVDAEKQMGQKVEVGARAVVRKVW